MCVCEGGAIPQGNSPTTPCAPLTKEGVNCERACRTGKTGEVRVSEVKRDTLLKHTRPVKAGDVIVAFFFSWMVPQVGCLTSTGVGHWFLKAHKLKGSFATSKLPEYFCSDVLGEFRGSRSNKRQRIRTNFHSVFDTILNCINTAYSLKARHDPMTTIQFTRLPNFSPLYEAQNIFRDRMWILRQQ